MARQFECVTLDVFTHRRLYGNQLAVFTNALGLSDGEMQDLAREMNYSETTFVLPAAAAAPHATPVRIFTVAEELPFAGHPTLGTAYVLAGGQAERVTLDLPVGPIPVSFADGEHGRFGEMVQREPVFSTLHDRDAVAGALRMDAGLICTDVPIQSVSTGNDFAIVPLRDLAALRNLRLDLEHAQEYCAKTGTKFFYFVSRQTQSPAARLQARMRFYGGEDPATGSAAGPAAAWMVKCGIAGSGERVMIEQGVEIKRPSQLYVSARSSGGRIHDVRVGGYCVEVMRGVVTL